jgi:hypothetical protein
MQTPPSATEVQLTPSQLATQLQQQDPPAQPEWERLNPTAEEIASFPIATSTDRPRNSSPNSIGSSAEPPSQSGLPQPSRKGRYIAGVFGPYVDVDALSPREAIARKDAVLAIVRWTERITQIDLSEDDRTDLALLLYLQPYTIAQIRSGAELVAGRKTFRHLGWENWVDAFGAPTYTEAQAADRARREVASYREIERQKREKLDRGPAVVPEEVQWMKRALKAEIDVGALRTRVTELDTYSRHLESRFRRQSEILDETETQLRIVTAELLAMTSATTLTV